LPGRNLQLLHSENGFYATLTAQADTDSNQQPEFLGQYAIHTAPHGSVSHSCLILAHFS
jgi:hypothetical protein